ncbi:MAG TPA: NAD-dependent epimerase/dehydratase family protein [Isosphaeraceae bacterium]|nr:NAD-dependent epimerase/dehydratase family protein [Isosphaeraceae bacterium]
MEPSPRFWTGKRVCVTGGTGLLGYQLVEQLLELGARVRVLALPPTEPHPILKQQSVAKIFADVRDIRVVQQAVADCDVVFHTAGIVAMWRSERETMWDVHVEGTRNVLKAARPDARVVHTSSSVTLGGSQVPEERDEESQFELHGLRVGYVHAKRASERLALEAALAGQDVVVTNPAYMVGPGDHGRSVMGRFCTRFWKGRVLVIPPGGFSLVDVRDSARGHLLAAEHGQRGRQYILGGENHTFGQFIGLLAEAGGLSPRQLPEIPRWALLVLATISEARAKVRRKEPYPSYQHVELSRYFWYYRSDRAALELGYHFRPLSACLYDTYRWYFSLGELGLRRLNRWWMRPNGSLEQAA